MFKPILAAAAAVLMLAPAAGARTIATGSFDWKPPCSQPVQETDQAGKTSFTCSTEAEAYMLIVDVSEEGAEPEAIYDNNVESVGKATKGILRTSGPITVNGLTGREALYDIPGGAVVRCRWFIAKGLFYAFTYYGPAGSENSKAATDFLDSFRLKP